jgi:hypothetical protein
MHAAGRRPHQLRFSSAKISQARPPVGVGASRLLARLAVPSNLAATCTSVLHPVMAMFTALVECCQPPPFPQPAAQLVGDR